MEIVSGRSLVWRKFKRSSLDEKETRYVICNSCKFVMVHDNLSGKGGLFRHKFGKDEKDQQPQVSSFFTKTPMPKQN